MRRSLQIMLAFALLAVTLSACEDDEREPLSARVTAFLEDAVSVRSSAIEQRIRALPSVTDVRFISKEQAYEKVKETLGNSPDLLKGVEPNTLSASFEATVTDGALAEVVQLVIGAFDGISGTALAAGEGDVESQEQIGVLVRLTAGVTSAQRDAVEKLVGEMPRVEGISYETPEQTKDRLRKRCRGKADLPALFEQVSLSDLHASFRFRIGLHGGEVPQLSTLQGLEGVDGVSFVPAEVVY